MKRNTFDHKQVKKTMNIVRSVILLILIVNISIFLTGCSTTSETFDTEFVKGVGAKSITQVNGMVERGEIENLKFNNSSSTSPIFVTESPFNKMGDPIQLSSNTLVYRQPEKHLRVWIAPFQDQRGDLYEASIVHTLMRSGYWQMNAENMNG